MARCRCEQCGRRFDKDKAIERFDNLYESGSYNYNFLWNDFCFECAKELYEENDWDREPYYSEWED